MLTNAEAVRAVSMWYAGLAVDDEDSATGSVRPGSPDRGRAERVCPTRDQSVGNTLHT